MVSNTYVTLDDAYHEVLRHLLFKPDYYCEPRGQKIREILQYTFAVLKPTPGPVVTRDPERNKVIAEYTAKEFVLYNSLSRQASDYSAASAFWGKLANPDGTINSAYGYLIFGRRCCGAPIGMEHSKLLTPWQWAMESLKADRDTRQSILYFNTPNFASTGVIDFPCTLFGHFFIRENALQLMIRLRSNDVFFGLPYDSAWFISLMSRAVEELKPTYPDLTVGTYFHTADSMHLYDRNLAAAAKMAGLENRLDEIIAIGTHGNS